MYTKIKDFFTKNLIWKAFSILIASLLWFVVMNINNPTEIKTFFLPLNLSNLNSIYKQDMTVLNLDELEQTKVELKLKATRPVLDELTKMLAKSQINAYIDISSVLNYNDILSPLETNFNIKTNLSNIQYPNNNFEIVSFLPSNISITLDKLVTVPKKININVYGEPKAGYIVSTPELSSEYIQVTGARSIIETIDYVSIKVDVSNKEATFSKKIKPIVYDKDGNVIENISFNLEEVSVKVPIILQGKLKIKEPKLTGVLPSGYSIKNISYSPKNIDVVGYSNSLKNITSIDIPPINISGLTQSKDFTFKINDILKPFNLSLKSRANQEIKISVEIEKTINKTIQINSSDISIIGINDKFVDLPENINIEISGTENVINTLEPSQIKSSLDLKDLSEGIHNVALQVELPKDVTLVNIPYLYVTISQIQTQTTDTSTTENINQTSSEIISETTSELTSEFSSETTSSVKEEEISQ